MEYRINPYFITISFLTVAMPLSVLPFVIDNPFDSPKSLVLLFGACILAGIYIFELSGSQGGLLSKTTTSKILLLLLFQNVFSFLYTANYYFTAKAAVLNISCLFLFYFVAIHIDSKRAFSLLIMVSAIGLLVSVISWFQIFDRDILLKLLPPGTDVVGTIGNSNYLGAYLIFPLFALAGLFFLFEGKTRFILAVLILLTFGAFLFARARSSWFGFFPSMALFVYLVLKTIYRSSLPEFLRSHIRQVAFSAIICVAIFVSILHFAPARFHESMGFENLISSETLRLRMKYIRPSFHLFKEAPLFGTGLWSFRNLVYDAQAEINKRDKSFFRNYPLRETKPRRVHTEYFEILNDGGLFSASVLLLFFLSVMRHGWTIMQDEKVDSQGKIVTAAAFCALIAIMIAALFFFPFRLNITMFMTVLMMGMIEGIYLHHYDLCSRSTGWNSKTKFVLIPVVFLLLSGFLWFTGIKPFLGEKAHFKYTVALANKNPRAAEGFILKAIEYDPHNTSYAVYAGQIYLNFFKNYVRASDFADRAIRDFNGDVTLWSLYYLKGQIKYRIGSLSEAERAFEQSLYCNPIYEPASQMLNEVRAIIMDNRRIPRKTK